MTVVVSLSAPVGGDDGEGELIDLLPAPDRDIDDEVEFAGLLRDRKRHEAADLDLIRGFLQEQALGLAERRIAAGLTQDELADAIGVGLQSIRRWEGGESPPSKRNREKLEAVLAAAEARAA